MTKLLYLVRLTKMYNLHQIISYVLLLTMTNKHFSFTIRCAYLNTTVFCKLQLGRTFGYHTCKQFSKANNMYLYYICTE